MGAVRLLISLVLLLVVAFWGYDRVTDRVQGEGGGPFAGLGGQTANVPPQFRELLGSFPTGKALLAKGGSLPGVGALVGDGDEDDEEDDRLRPFGDVGSHRAVARVKATVRRHLRTMSRFTRRFARSPEDAAAVVRRVYSRHVLDELGADGRAKLARGLAGEPSDPARSLSVVQFQGVFVAGRRALALLDYRSSQRFRRGGPWQRMPAKRWQITLIREDDRWRLVRGLE